jgi:RNA polymerase sigma-70 factor (ECF subfamily)
VPSNSTTESASNGATAEAAEGPMTHFASIFERMYVEQFDFVRRILRSYGVLREDVDDVAQDVFLKVYCLISTYDAARPAKPWLYAFAVRFAIDYRARVRHQREQLCPDVPDVADEELSAEHTLIACEEHQNVIVALNTLDPILRIILLRYEHEGAPMSKIAKQLGIPIDTGYTRLRRARERLRRGVARVVASRADGLMLLSVARASASAAG